MIYKTLKKVSDVCQLLDKSQYPATKTVNGITFTNNGDGSYTANGILSSYLSYLVVAQVSNLIVGHKYYSPNSSHISGVYIETKVLTNNANFIYIMDNIHEWVENETVMYITLVTDIGQNSSVENVILKPQLFDLTEMYGAGNEPTTVEEFRTKFPNELYDYKPYCFVKSYKTLLKATDNKIITSYKKSLICTTKNLFDISKVFSVPTLCFDVSSLEIGKTYTFSSNKPIIIFKISDFRGGYNSVIYSSTNGFTTFTFVMARDEHIPVTAKQYLFLWLLELSTGDINTSGFVTDISQLDGYNLQIELGDTATEYHPYGYL